MIRKAREIETSTRLAREMKKVMDVIGGSVQGCEEGTPSLPDDAREQLQGTIAEQAYAALAAADEWAAAKEDLPGDEAPEWLHLYRVARIVPFAVLGMATDPDVWVLSDLYDLLRDALEATDRVEAEKLAEELEAES